MDKLTEREQSIMSALGGSLDQTDAVLEELKVAHERLAVAKGLLKWVMSPDFYSTSRLRRDIPIQTFLSTSQVPGLVVVKREDLEEIRSLSVNIYDFSPQNYNRKEALRINEIVVNALERKEEGE